MTRDLDQNNPALSDEAEIVEAAAAALRNKRPLRSPRLRQAAEALRSNQLDDADHLLSNYLEQRPNDVRALHLLGETALKLGQRKRAEALLAQCVTLAPDFEAGRFIYASALYQLDRLELSLAELEHLLAADPQNILQLDMKAAVLTAMGRHADSMLCRRQLTEAHPSAPELWVKYGRALRAIGEREAAIGAFRRAISLNPSCGSAWWSLADLKTLRFSEADISAMESRNSRSETRRDDRIYLHFALGRAYASQKNYPKSFENYARANAGKRLTISYDPDRLSENVAKCKALFTRTFFESRSGLGADSAEPIFIVGMQRAGSTLVEQMLSSHSAIEATAELPDITLMAERLGETLAGEKNTTYPNVLASLDGAALRKLGENYLETTRFKRDAGKAFFVDKNPYNFLHLALIHLILPNSKIIDARRHPLACCWSNYTANFEMGALFAYRFNELGRAYSDYVELMAHFDAVLPGRVHRVFYEELVGDPTREIGRLLSHLGLQFEASCLDFHANTRAMNSVSSEQVRQPIFTDALDQWRHFEPSLGPLKSALGPVLDAYPGVPHFAS
ncbi:MAG TPA: sulfotransferase [Rhizomicrobium sp.]|jgi:tetratricopeptide (TPR) repeat protein